MQPVKLAETRQYRFSEGVDDVAYSGEVEARRAGREG